MNLETIVNQHDLNLHNDGQGGKCIILDDSRLQSDYDFMWCLFHLDDYAISTVSGPTYWLLPRSKVN